MRFVIQVKFEREELGQMEEAFLPFRQVSENSDATPEEKLEVAETAGRVEHGNLFSVRHLEMAVRACAVLRRVLEAQTKIEAAPEWVEQARKQIEAGQVPIVLDPTAAVETLREIRERQIWKLDGVTAYFRDALYNANRLLEEAEYDR